MTSRRDCSTSDTPRRWPKANATTLPITSASSGVIDSPIAAYAEPMTSGETNRTATISAISRRCQRSGGWVSGSLSMKPARNTIGIELIAVGTASTTAVPSATWAITLSTNAGTTNHSANPIRPVRYSTSSAPIATTGSMAPAATHQTDAPRPKR